MTMRRMAAFTGITVLIMSGAPALADEPTYYSGSHLCDAKLHFDDWRISRQASGAIAAEVYYRREDSRAFDRLELSAQTIGNDLRLSDARGRPRVAVRLSADQTKLEGQWLDYRGNPQKNCAPFTLATADSAMDRMDRVLELLATEMPSVDQARKAAHLQQTLPPLNLLPELDRENYRQRYGKEAPQFWSRFYDAELGLLRSMPVSTPEERVKLVEEMRAATAFNLTPQGSLANDNAARRAAQDALRTAADRLADTEEPLKPVDLQDRTACERLTAFNYPGITEFELIAGLPVEYWDRAVAEVVLAKAQQCEGAGSVVREITRSYPEIEQRQKAAAWLRAERDRLLALPATLATLRETGWLQVDRDALRKDNVSNHAYQRFAGDALKKHREEALAAAHVEIITSFASKSPETLPLDQAREHCTELLGQRLWGDEVVTRLFNDCQAAADAYRDTALEKLVQGQIETILAAPRTLEGLREANWFRLDTSAIAGWHPSAAARADFDNKILQARTEAVTNAVGEIEEAFATAEPFQPSDKAATALCQNLPLFADETMGPVIEACRNGSAALAVRRDEAQCADAIKRADPGSSILDASVEQPGARTPRIRVRDIICGGAKQKLEVTFPTSGMLWWAKQHIEIRLPDKVGNAPMLIRGRLEKAEDTDEQALRFVDAEPVGMEKLPAPEDRLLACVARPAQCM